MSLFTQLEIVVAQRFLFYSFLKLLNCLREIKRESHERHEEYRGVNERRL